MNKPWSIICQTPLGAYPVAFFVNYQDAVDRLRFMKKRLPGINCWLMFTQPEIPGISGGKSKT